MNIPQDQRDALQGLLTSANEDDSQYASSILDIIADFDSNKITAEECKSQISGLTIPEAGMINSLVNRILAD